MNKAYIFKLSRRPCTLDAACRVRYYIRVCAQQAILRAIEDLNVSLERILFNCEMVMQPPQLDHEQYTDFVELQEIATHLQEPIYGFIAAAVTQMDARCVLNISASIYDHDQLLLSHEVYAR